MDTTALPSIRLTEFSHGGGCGCKIAPGVLRELIAKSSPGLLPKELLVGIETSDDAAVYRLNDGQAIVATTDFFTPIVDDPFAFGAIAATNALSDIYAMGATPLFALALVAMPLDRLPLATIRAILAGGEATCARAGIPLAGGHTIDSVEPIYGLVAIGTVDPLRVKRNVGAMSGDVLVLGKPLGIGICGAALKKEQLGAEQYTAMVAQATQLNTPGVAFGSLDGVHALTDVTGFGLLGHLHEVCEASGVGVEIDAAAVPALPGALELAASGKAEAGGSRRNAADAERFTTWGEDVPPERRALLTDAMTSGGLLAAVPPGATMTGVKIGTLVEGAPRIAVS
jgi:selenide,water dikinase